MEHLINQIHKTLIKKGFKVAVAESCTGGQLSSLLTRNPGSSQYFMLGVVSYSNRSKIDLLGIPPKVILKYGAVSRQTAGLMAHSARRLAHADLGISVTGIAGPQGGSRQKPVGTVFIAIDSRKLKTCARFCFKGNRSSVRSKSANKALALLEKVLAKI